jgi:hypothetical protein
MHGRGGAIYAQGGTVRFSRLIGNYAPDDGDTLYGPISAGDNWWGSNTGHSAADLGGSASAPSWLVLGAAADPPAISPAQTASIRANLTYNSAGVDTSGSGTIQNLIPVHFTATGGTVFPEYAVTSTGIAPATFTPSGPGTATVTAMVDSQSVSVPVEVTTATTGTNVTSIVVDPATPVNIWAGLDGSGIYRSTNGGADWTNTGTQPANLFIRALAINTSYPNTLYAGTYGGGLYRSTDSGVSWTACGTAGLTNPYVLSLVRNMSGAIYAGTDDGVFMSSNECASWMAMSGGLP